MAVCPILPTRIPEGSIALRTDFISNLQEAINATMVTGETPLPVDGIYGPETGQELLSFMLEIQNNTGEMPDNELFIATGETLAGCETYNRLGLDCDRVIPQMTEFSEFRPIFEQLVDLQIERPNLFSCIAEGGISPIILAGGIILIGGLLITISTR